MQKTYHRLLRKRTKSIRSTTRDVGLPRVKPLCSRGESAGRSFLKPWPCNTPLSSIGGRKSCCKGQHGSGDGVKEHCKREREGERKVVEVIDEEVDDRDRETLITAKKWSQYIYPIATVFSPTDCKLNSLAHEQHKYAMWVHGD